jgi:hypothetical protein
MFLDVAALKYHLFPSRAEVRNEWSYTSIYIPSWGEEGQPHLCHASVWIQFVVSEVQMEAKEPRKCTCSCFYVVCACNLSGCFFGSSFFGTYWLGQKLANCAPRRGADAWNI